MIEKEPGGWARYVATVALLAACYVLGGRLGFTASAVHPVVSSAWPPSGIALAALLLLGKRFWPAITLGAFVVNLTGGIAPLGAAGIAAGNTLEALLGAWLLTSFAGFRPSLERLRDVLALVLAAIASTPVSATIGVTVLILTGGAAGIPPTTIWLTWCSGDAIGILVVAPLALTWAAGPKPRVAPRDVIEAAALSSLLIAFTVVLFQTRFSYVYAIFPVTIWAAIRFGLRGAATSSLVVAVLAIGYTVRGVGPFSDSTAVNNLFQLQTFIFLLALTSLILAAVIAERRTAESALERSRQQHLDIEKQFQQAQKMEAVGRLAGGVAHDFNNLLTVISSCTDFILDDQTLPAEHRADLTEVKKATDRATSLTRQLLALGRTQMLRPSTLDLNDRLAELLPMLKRLFETTIEINIEPASGLWAVRADPGQVEQVLLNLALNARDAMPDGGTLTFATQNSVIAAEAADPAQEYAIKPGDYVLLSVRDSGIGMDEDTQRKIFEPFFTTKEVGKGSGLGLATAYGIVKQSGGYIKVRSVRGTGSEFLIYLPRTDAVPERIVTPERRANGAATGTLLVVEDEAAVRNALQRMLTAEGYTVVTAANGAEALEIFSIRKDEIDLLITDIVMPVMNGRALAQKCCSLRDTLKVLYISGYTWDSLLSQQTFEEGTEFIQKPFTRDALVERIGRVLS